MLVVVVAIFVGGGGGCCCHCTRVLVWGWFVCLRVCVCVCARVFVCVYIKGAAEGYKFEIKRQQRGQSG